MRSSLASVAGRRIERRFTAHYGEESTFYHPHQACQAFQVGDFQRTA